MALSKTEKKEVLEKIGNVAKSAESLVFVNFHGLKVHQATELRRTLREKGVGFFVSKKTLLSKVLSEQKYSGSIPELDGEIGVAYGSDMIAPVREVYQFQKKWDKDKVLSIVAGMFDGSYKNKEEMLSIATIPSREILLGMFVNVLNSPIQGLVVALGAIANKKGVN